MNKVNKILFINLLFIKISCSYKFLFSVIISIYNTGRYLDDSIGSVLNQTIGINQIQIILVNDGSTDETEKKCLKYQKLFPKNIKYIKIEHSGVSVGRNIGLKYAEGKFINFLDADDKWNNKAFQLVLIFFRYYKKINIIGCRIQFFELYSSYHPLDYKFTKTRVVNLNKEYNCIQLSSSSSFFRHSLIKNKKFKPGIFNGEDTRFINNILLKDPNIGLIKEAIYYYRKRKDSTSAIQNKVKEEEFYSFIIKSVDQYLLNKSINLYNRIEPFIQYYLAYNSLFRIIIPSYLYLEPSKFYSYSNLFENIIKHVEDKYIIEQKILSLKEKLLLLSKKYKKDIRNDVKLQNEYFIYSQFILINLKQAKNILLCKILEVKNDYLHLECKDNFFLSQKTYFYYCSVFNTIIYPKYIDFSGYDLITMFGRSYKGRIVIFDIPIKDYNNISIKFYLSYKGIDSEIFPFLGWFSHIPNIKNGYYSSKKYILKIIENRIHIFKYKKNKEEKFEKEYCNQLRIIHKDHLINYRTNFIKYKNKNKYNRQIWLINDKLSTAGENGEYFFRYLKRKNPKNLIYYYIINSNCSDFIRLKKLGNIIKFGSEKHLKIYLKSDKILSSEYETNANNPFENEYKYIRDLIHFDYIFIQHGIIKDDLSFELNKIIRNFNLILTSSKNEYKSILKQNYGYNENNIIITGLPRYDNLQKLQNYIKKEKIILIFPTWRKYIKNSYDYKTYESIYSFTFNLTKYFNFYNNLINNDKLLKHMEKYNYTGILCLHPYFSKQWIDFKQNKIFSVLSECNYQNLLLKSSLLITDYSSIFFDFGYLNKPVIYAHFDYYEYRTNHFRKGYFDYIRNGFGVVCFNPNCLIKSIILQINKGCLLEKIYLKRINNFFKYKDNKNCERLYSNLINYSNDNNNKLNNENHLFIIFSFFLLILIKFY